MSATYNMTEVKAVYTELSAIVKNELLEEFNNGRIKGTEYADTYKELILNIIKLSFNAPILNEDITLKGKEIEIAGKTLTLKDKEITNADKALELKDKEMTLADKEIAAKEKELELADVVKDYKEEQKNLTIRQREGFDQNIMQKLTEMQLNAWSVMYSSGLLTDKPSIIDNDALSSAYNDLAASARKDVSVLKGADVIGVLTPTTYIINNYDSDASYTVSASNGTITGISSGSDSFQFAFPSDAVSGDKAELTLMIYKNGITNMDIKKVKYHNCPSTANDCPE